MEPFSKIKHKLIRDGKSQLERGVAALAPDFVKVDGRDMEDFLKFIFEFARQINYYQGTPEKINNDWTSFFIKSFPVQIALISKYNIEATEERFQEVSEAIQANVTFESLNLLFDLSFDLADQLEQWLRGLQGDVSGLHQAIKNLIDTNLSFALKTLIGHANAAGKWGYSRPKNISNLQNYWSFNMAEVFNVDRTLLQLKGSQKKQVLEAKILLDELALVFIKGVKEIVRLTNPVEGEKGLLEKSFEAIQTHEPHLGLFYAFLRLYQRVQGEINDLSRRHLEFFYRDILALEEKGITADHAHLVFELAKQADPTLLGAGTLFTAGKDENGVEVLFKLEEEVIVDNAQIASLRTLHLGYGDNEGTRTVTDVHMAAVANSADGIGEEDFVEENPSWYTIGAKVSKFFDEEKNQLQEHPNARLGFILASRVLQLKEGERRVTIKITTKENWPAALDENAFKVYFTGEEGWFGPIENIEKQCYDCDESTADGDTVLCLTATLDSTQPPVLFPGAEFFEADYGHREPMVLLELDHELARFTGQEEGTDASFLLYHDLRCLKISDIEINVNVCDVRNLVVQSDLGLLDPNKPFQPFGPIPKKDSSNFYIGSEEVFSKNWKKIDININWKDLPTVPEGSTGDPFTIHYSAYGPHEPVPNTNSFRVNASILDEKVWTSPSWFAANPLLLFNPGTGPICAGLDFAYHFHFEKPADFDCQENILTACKASLADGYTVDSQCGFIRLKLGHQDFLHEKYPKVLARQLLAMADENESRLFFTGRGELDGQVIVFQTEVSNLENTLNEEGEAAKDSLSNDDNDNPGTIELAEDTKTATQSLFDDIDAIADDLSNFDHNDLPDLETLAGDANNAAQDTVDKAEEAKNNLDALCARIDEITNRLETLRQIPEDIPLPNEPYTPTIENISMNYCACATWEEGIALTHLYPFEGTYLPQPKPEDTTDPALCPSVLPYFYPEGHLFIGLDNYTPGSNLSILFQLAPSTADPDIDKATVCWHYLKDNTWIALEKDIHILADETDGLIQSGVIKFAIPTRISSKATTIMPSDLHWIRATVRERTAAIAETIAIHTQAARVVFVPGENNDLQRPEKALDAGTIGKPVVNNAAIKGINQAYNGFGGRAKETSSKFYTRVSEHLRHKGRAITLYDYERLVMEQYPEIFKVKCITHTMGRRGANSRDFELSPGFVTIVVIPDLRTQEVVDTFKPRVTLSKLENIKAFLAARISPFIRLQVLNPQYQDINVEASVKFAKGKSPAFYEKTLEEEIRLYLAPWANPGQEEEIAFGGRIFKSSIINFIEQRPYVDYLIDFKMYLNDQEPTNEITASSARSILTGGVIEITALDDENCSPTGTQILGRGIGYTTIGN